MSRTRVKVPARECVVWHGILIHPTIVSRIERLVEGHPRWVVTSGWRSEATNAAVGGVPNSRHLSGCAVDMVLPQAEVLHGIVAARKLGAMEAIDEGDHLHVGFPRPL